MLTLYPASNSAQSLTAGLFSTTWEDTYATKKEHVFVLFELKADFYIWTVDNSSMFEDNHLQAKRSSLAHKTGHAGEEAPRRPRITGEIEPCEVCALEK
jgi:hypothetical protein